MAREIIRFIELPPFDSFIIGEKSSWTFGVNELFSKLEYDLEVFVSDDSKSKVLEDIVNHEKTRSAANAVLQGVGGSGAGMGIAATAGAAASCPACYPVYAAFAPFVAAGASALVLPALYGTAKRLGQRKIMRSLVEFEEWEIKVVDYDPPLEISSEQELENHLNWVEHIQQQPRKGRDQESLAEHKFNAYVGLLSLQQKASQLAKEKDDAMFKVLADAYGKIATRYGKGWTITSPMIIKRVQYEPISKKSLALAGVGAALLITGGVLWATDTNPLDYLVGQEQDIPKVQEVAPIKYPTDTLLVEGMTCESCTKGLEENLEDYPEIKDVTIDFNKKTAIVMYDNSKLTHEQMLELIPKPHSAKIVPHTGEVR